MNLWTDRCQATTWVLDTRYLLDAYPALLRSSAPERLEAIYSDAAYVEASVRTLGVERVASDLNAAATGLAGDAARHLSRVLRLEAHHIRPPWPLDEPGYVTRQITLQALQCGVDDLAERARQRLALLPAPQLMPKWTTGRTPQALLHTLEGHTAWVGAVALTGDGARAVSAGGDGTLRVWDLASGCCLIVLSHAHTATSLALADAGKLLVGDQHGGVTLHNLLG